MNTKELKYKVSKELLEAVLGFEINSIKVTNTYIVYQQENHDETILIDELFCKCLEYSLNNDYSLYFHKWSGVRENEFMYQCICNYSQEQFNVEINYKQALFSACEEILNKQKE